MQTVEVSEEVTVNPVHTACKTCVFAQWEGDTQYGCGFNDRIGKFSEQGHVIDVYDEEKKFFVVNGRKCSAFRDEGWAKHFPVGDRYEMARRELALRVDVVTVLEDGEDASRIRAFVTGVGNSSVKPSSVVVVNNQGHLPVGLIHHSLAQCEGVNWQLVDVRERDVEGNRVSRERAIDLGVEKAVGHFYTLWRTYEVPPKRFIEKLDKAITDDLHRSKVFVSSHADGNGLTVALGFHRSSLVMGNKPVPIVSEDGNEQILTDVCEKAKFIALAHDVPHLVAPVTPFLEQA